MANPQQQADDIFPFDFASWHHCIAVKCGVPLSADYVAERIAVLSDKTMWSYRPSRYLEDIAMYMKQTK